MNDFKPNSIEAVIVFILYICIQDGRISKEESIKNFFEAVKLYNVEKEFGLKIYKKNIKEKDLNKIISLPENYKLTINDEIIEINF